MGVFFSSSGDLEQFLDKIRFNHREKLEDLPLE